MVPSISGKRDVHTVIVPCTSFRRGTPEWHCSSREARRTLRPRGRLAVVSMALGSEAQQHGIPERMYVWMHQHFPHIIDCRPIDVERRLEESGFTIERTERIVIWGLPVVAALAR